MEWSETIMGVELDDDGHRERRWLLWSETTMAVELNSHQTAFVVDSESPFFSHRDPIVHS